MPKNASFQGAFASNSIIPRVNYHWKLRVICSISKLHKYVNNLTNNTDYIVEDYEKLSENQKKEIALRLLNNAEFQKDCCEILVSDMERIAKSDETVKAINDVFNITGWCKNLIKQGIGMNHKYEV